MNVRFGLTLIFFINVFINACSEQFEIQPGTQLYQLAKALSLKFEALHPDSNFVLISTSKMNVTNKELLHHISLTEGIKSERLRHLNPVVLKEYIYNQAEELALKKLLLREANEHNISIDKTELDSIQTAKFKAVGGEEEFLSEIKKLRIDISTVKTEMKERVLVQKYLESVLADKISVTEDEIQDELEKDKSASFRHILLSTEGKTENEKAMIKNRIQKLRQRIERGEDLSDLAKKYSEDTGSKSTGGLYQDMERTVMDSAFAVTVFSLKIGELSEIVESSFGYHIVKVLDRKKDDLPPSEIKSKIAQRLKSQKFRAASVAYIEKFKEELNFKIVNPDNS